MKTQEAIQLFVTNRQLQGVAVSTVKQYQQQLSRLLQSDKLITNPADIEAIIASIQGTQETKHSYFRTYRAFYNFLEKRYDIKNPMVNVTAPRLKPKVMPTLEANEISLINLFTNNERDNTVISLLLDTGIRASELANLRFQDIKLSVNCITVSGKTGQRVVPISEFVADLLLRQPNSKDGYVFHGHSGKLTRSGVYRIVSRALIRIGIQGPKLGPHRLRHTFGRQWITLGGDVRSLQIILGHSNIKTTEKYANLNFNDVAIKHRKFSPAQLMEVNK